MCVSLWVPELHSVLQCCMLYWLGGGGRESSLWVTPMHALDLWEPVTMHLGWWSIQWYLCSQLCVWVYVGLCVLWVYCYMSVCV